MREIGLSITGDIVKKSVSTAGVQGGGNVDILRMTFDTAWDTFAKKCTCWDARGENPVARTLTSDLCEDLANDPRTYCVPLPAEPLAHGGECTIVIDGYQDGKRARSCAVRLRVMAAPIADDAGEPVDPTPSQAEQLQVQIDQIMGDISKAAEGALAAERAEKSAQEAAESAGAAEEFADNASQSAADAATARTGAETAVASAQSAQRAAESAKNLADASAQSAAASAAAASASADAADASARGAAASESASGIAKETAIAAAGAAAEFRDDAETAQAGAETAQAAARDWAENAEEQKTAAADYKTAAQSWAVGETGTREGEDVNNAKYWSEVAQQAAGGGVSSFNGRGGAVTAQAGDYDADMVGADAKGTAAAVQVAAAQDATAKANAAAARSVPLTQRGAAEGVATLDANGKVPLAQINDAILGNVIFQDVWDASTGRDGAGNALPAPGEGNKGWYWVTQVAGTYNGTYYANGDWIISHGDRYDKVDNTDEVSSVNGKTGAVLLGAADVGADAAGAAAAVQTSLNAHAANRANPHNVTAAQVGAASSAELDAMKIYNLYWWRRRTPAYTVEKRTQGESFQMDWKNSNSKYLYYSDGFTMEGATFTLANPDSIYVSASNFASKMTASLIGKYITGLEVSSGLAAYLIDANTTSVRSSYVVTINSVTKVEAEVIPSGAWEYVQSSNPNAYPNDGIENGYEYISMGKPFDNAAYRPGRELLMMLHDTAGGTTQIDIDLSDIDLNDWRYLEIVPELGQNATAAIRLNSIAEKSYLRADAAGSSSATYDAFGGYPSNGASDPAWLNIRLHACKGAIFGEFESAAYNGTTLTHQMYASTVPKWLLVPEQLESINFIREAGFVAGAKIWVYGVRK